jgi:hypothetical protein
MRLGDEHLLAGCTRLIPICYYLKPPASHVSIKIHRSSILHQFVVFLKHFITYLGHVLDCGSDCGSKCFSLRNASK